MDKSYLEAWAKQYSDPDSALEGLSGKKYLTKEEAAKVIGWKLQKSWAKKHAREFDTNEGSRVKELTERAFESEDPLEAILILSRLHGVGTRTASALLTAHDRERFTVIDDRAWKTIRAHNLLEDYAESDWLERWKPYLQTCRFISSETGVPLREVDKALWAANGNTEVPI